MKSSINDCNNQETSQEEEKYSKYRNTIMFNLAHKFYMYACSNEFNGFPKAVHRYSADERKHSIISDLAIYGLKLIIDYLNECPELWFRIPKRAEGFNKMVAELEENNSFRSKGLTLKDERLYRYLIAIDFETPEIIAALGFDSQLYLILETLIVRVFSYVPVLKKDFSELYFVKMLYGAILVENGDYRGFDIANRPGKNNNVLDYIKNKERYFNFSTVIESCANAYKDNLMTLSKRREIHWNITTCLRRNAEGILKSAWEDFSNFSEVPIGSIGILNDGKYIIKYTENKYLNLRTMRLESLEVKKYDYNWCKILYFIPDTDTNKNEDVKAIYKELGRRGRKYLIKRVNARVETHIEQL